MEAENLSLNKLNSEIERVHSSKSELSVQLSRQLKKLDSSTLKLKDLRSSKSIYVKTRFKIAYYIFKKLLIAQR